MNEQYFYADPEVAFHVWVREQGRWVLRDASKRGAQPLRTGAARLSEDGGGSSRGSSS